MSKQWLILIIIIVVAFVFRFQNLTSTPPGLGTKEAVIGNIALRALDQGPQLVYSDQPSQSGLFIYLQSLALGVFGNQIWALHIVSALAGVLTILGLYLLTRKLFNWQTAALASFLLAVSLWHVALSRVGLSGILSPLCAVWAFYFLWLGLSSSNHVHFAVSGIFWGLGFYTGTMFWPIPVAAIIVLLAYQHMIAKDYAGDRYEHIRRQIGSGLGGLLVVAVLVLLPLGFYYYTHTGSLLQTIRDYSIIGPGESPLTVFTHSIRTLGAFNFIGDQSWLFNIAGEPLLYWPIGVLFFIGLIKTCLKLAKRRKSHDHFSTVQVLLLSWFIAGLIPALLSAGPAPSSYLLIQAIPAIFIMVGVGLWWLYEFMNRWQRIYDIYHISFTTHPNLQNTFLASTAIVILVSAFGIAEYNRYFNIWANSPEVSKAYNAQVVSVSNQLNNLPDATNKYVVYRSLGNKSAPQELEVIQFITHTETTARQNNRNLYYISQYDFSRIRIKAGAFIVSLE